MSVNRDAIRKWVDALRSGEYEQGTGTLHPDGQYCCLGVACEVYKQETGQGKWTDLDVDGPPHFVVSEQMARDTLPPVVADWLFGDGYQTSPEVMGDVDDDGYASTCELANLNDCYCTFARIADLIEREWLT